MYSFQYGKKLTNLLELNVTYDNNRIKQYHMVEDLGCCFDAYLSGESMAMKSFRKINTVLILTKWVSNSRTM